MTAQNNLKSAGVQAALAPKGSPSQTQYVDAGDQPLREAQRRVGDWGQPSTSVQVEDPDSLQDTSSSAAVQQQASHLPDLLQQQEGFRWHAWQTHSSLPLSTVHQILRPGVALTLMCPATCMSLSIGSHCYAKHHLHVPTSVTAQGRPSTSSAPPSKEATSSRPPRFR